MKKSPKVILITGCSSGFGLLSAIHLAKQHHHVIATLRDLTKGADLKTAAKEANVTIDIQTLDVTHPETIKPIVDYIMKRYQRLDVLVNNAGFSMGGFFEDLSDADIRSVLETNFFGVQNMTRAILPIMRRQKEGKIINISSIAGLNVYPCLSAYNVSKWALEAFSECLYYELKPFNIKVCMIEPGSYRTKIFEQNARYATRFNDPNSPYYTFSKAMKKLTMDSIQKNQRDPIQIAHIIEKLIVMKNPPLRTIPGLSVKSIYWLRKFLPFSWYSKIVENVFLSKISIY